MSWINLSIVSTRDQAEEFSDFLLEHGALSSSIQDKNLNSNDEEMIFGEPHNGPQQFWQHTQIDAMFNNDREAKKALAALENLFNVKLRPELKNIEDQDWVKLTQAQFHPISIRDQVWIIPSWHSVQNEKAINLILDPGLAFGTGSHPTTHLCIEWLLDNLGKGDDVLDYGCGSGILAICAKKLGANKVLAVDIDPQAIIASNQNAAINNVSIDVNDTKEKFSFKANIIVANILSSALTVLAPAIASSCLPKGKIALSGVLKSQENEIKEIYSTWFSMNESSYKDGWVCLSGEKN